VKRAANDAAHWRDFDHNYVTHSMAHYLTAIDSLRKELGYARATDVADFLEVSRGAASMALAQLKKRAWVAEDPNRFLLLTEEGARIAELVEGNFTILSRFFEEVLGAPRDRAVSDACKMEHLMSMETGQRLVWLMSNLLADDTLLGHVRNTMRGFEPIGGREGQAASKKRPKPRTARQPSGAREQRA
jgi:Mn-dependent DtxR family transcriptional regulator